MVIWGGYHPYPRIRGGDHWVGIWSHKQMTNSLASEDNCSLEFFYALAKDKISTCEDNFTIFTRE